MAGEMVVGGTGKPKGQSVVIAGTAYVKPPRPRKVSKRKVTGGRSGSRKRARTQGDYDINSNAYSMFHFGSSVGKTNMKANVGGLDIAGRGDYIMGPRAPISQNVLMNGREVPKFKSGYHGATVVTHREYIGDIISGTTAGSFNVQSFLLNPGNSITFPWLSNLAAQYEEYSWHGMIFEFRTTSSDALNSTNTALGTVVMATEYNANRASFTSKVQMENYEFAQSAKPSLSQIHGVECDPREGVLSKLYVRDNSPSVTGAVEDARFYDFGTFQIATSGMQASAVTVGELWVSYCVELYKPNLGGPSRETSYHLYSTGVSSGVSPIGSTIALQSGSLSGVTKTGTVISWPTAIGKQYNVYVIWSGPSTVNLRAPTASATGAVGKNLIGGGSANFQIVPFPYTSTGQTVSYTGCLLSNSNLVSITFALDGTLPAGSVDIFIHGVDAAVTV